MEQASEYHIPVLLKESVNGLNIRPNGVYVDVTFGGGGHSREILNRLENGKLIAFDQDTDAAKNAIDDPRFVLVQHNFKYLKNFLRHYEIDKVDGILADLGVSSHHFDQAERGFSFRFKSKLDMRMNTQSDKTAADILNQADEKQLNTIFKNYGEIRNSFKITRAIINFRKETKIETSEQLQEILARFIPKQNQHKFLAKLYQALRIEVNDEMGVLRKLLTDSIDTIKVGGRLVFISYHSLEDRLVKNFMKMGKFSGELEQDIYGNIIAPFKQIHRKAIVADKEELQKNKRARSGKLRIAERRLGVLDY